MAGEVKLCKIEGVQVYSRKNEQGKPTRLDGQGEDEGKIRRISDTLQRRGFGVMRQTHHQAGKVRYRFHAQWVREGDPPDNPFVN